jgi:hypothetical protein
MNRLRRRCAVALGAVTTAVAGSLVPTPYGRCRADTATVLLDTDLHQSHPWPRLDVTAGLDDAFSRLEERLLYTKAHLLPGARREHRAASQPDALTSDFLDKRLADLEAALVEAQLPPGPAPDQRPSRMG